MKEYYAKGNSQTGIPFSAKEISFLIQGKEKKICKISWWEGHASIFTHSGLVFIIFIRNLNWLTTNSQITSLMLSLLLLIAEHKVLYHFTYIPFNYRVTTVYIERINLSLYAEWNHTGGLTVVSDEALYVALIKLVAGGSESVWFLSWYIGHCIHWQLLSIIHI